MALGSGDIATINTSGEVVAGAYIDSHGVVNGLDSSIQIYDCYLDVTYTDGLTARFRPQFAVMQNDGESGFGAIANASGAIDVDATSPATFATLLRTDYDSLDFLTPSKCILFSRDNAQKCRRYFRRGAIST